MPVGGWGRLGIPQLFPARAIWGQGDSSACSWLPLGFWASLGFLDHRRICFFVGSFCWQFGWVVKVSNWGCFPLAHSLGADFGGRILGDCFKGLPWLPLGFPNVKKRPNWVPFAARRNVSPGEPPHCGKCRSRAPGERKRQFEGDLLKGDEEKTHFEQAVPRFFGFLFSITGRPRCERGLPLARGPLNRRKARNGPLGVGFGAGIFRLRGFVMHGEGLTRSS